MMEPWERSPEQAKRIGQGPFTVPDYRGRVKSAAGFPGIQIESESRLTPGEVSQAGYAAEQGFAVERTASRGLDALAIAAAVVLIFVCSFLGYLVSVAH